MQTNPTTQPTHTTSPPVAPSAYYCSCAIPLAVERAERHGAATRVCTRCELPIAISFRRW